MNEARDFIEELVAAGLDPIQAGDIIARAMIAATSNAPRQRSSGAIRQERYRRNKASLVTESDVSDASPAPLDPPLKSPPDPEKITPPISPISDACASDAPSASGPTDWRDKLWTEGPPLVARLTGKTSSAARSLIGRWLRDAADDCRHVLAKIKEAEVERIGNPVPWITAAVKAHAPPSIDAERHHLYQRLDDIKNGKCEVPTLLEVINGGKSHEPAHTGPTIDASFERTDFGSVGHLVQNHALPSGRRS